MVWTFRTTLQGDIAIRQSSYCLFVCRLVPSSINISGAEYLKNGGVRGSVAMDHQYCRKCHGESNGHVIDDATWPWKVKVVSEMYLDATISKAVRDRTTDTGMAYCESNGHVIKIPDGGGLHSLNVFFSLSCNIWACELAFVAVCSQLWSYMEKLLYDVVSTCKYMRDNISELPQLIHTLQPFGYITITKTRTINGNHCTLLIFALYLPGERFLCSVEMHGLEHEFSQTFYFALTYLFTYLQECCACDILYMTGRQWVRVTDVK